ncbi:MAG: polyphosphate polymerase domain-containing protein [Saccharofermentans sp.]|nr:polyphosphate polymerase domain-containing protein [Saccharofermentans sp.]
MAYTNVFARYEIKYLIDKDQKDRLVKAMEGRMKEDHYGHTTIRNIYFDTPDQRLIRTSLDKPEYKEKLRVRSYKKVTEDEDIFVELKKKFEGVVYKRRTAMPEHLASRWLCEGGKAPYDTQIVNEIAYLMEFYKTLEPKVFLSYERDAYLAKDKSGLRITFDSNIIARDHDLTLTKNVYGDKVIPQDQYVLEIKVSGGMPLWLTEFLTGNRLQKTSFSKYGAYYINNIRKEQTNKGELLYA